MGNSDNNILVSNNYNGWCGKIHILVLTRYGDMEKSMISDFMVTPEAYYSRYINYNNYNYSTYNASTTLGGVGGAKEAARYYY